MTTFAVTNSNQLLPAVNYLLSNLDTGAGNVTLPGNVLVANTTTGVISQEGSSTPFGYLYQYVNLRYSNNATGTAGFDTNSNNYSYFGVYNSATSAPSSNPSAYQWYQVSPPFSTASARTLYYSSIGGRQIQWAAASAPPSTSYQVTVANVAIDLDVVTTAEGTPGERGPVAMSYVITTANPATATSLQLTAWFEASRENTVPPIGTGLTPVVGDTAVFTWAAGPSQPTATYSYNGSTWLPATPQVITGNVIIPGTLNGNTIAANTVTSTQIAANTITANNIAVGTITSNRIAANTITSNNIATGTITATNIAANTITSNNIAANTITANRIATGTLTTNLFTAGTINANILTANTFAANTISGQAIIANTFTANTINGNAIIANTFAANTINGNSIVSGSITTDKLAANVLTANTVISTGATIGDFNSPGFWLQGNTGTARFGNAVSIGNQLTVGNNAVIGGNLSIGGNLNISGLVTSSSLNANTVDTGQVVINAISSGISNVRTSNTVISSNQSQGTQTALTGVASISVPSSNTAGYIWWDASTLTTYSGSGTIYLQYTLLRSVGGGPFTQLIQQLTGPFDPFVVRTEPGFSYFDNNMTSFGPGVTYRYVVNIAWIAGNGSPSFVVISSNFNNIIVQSLKR